MWDTNSFMCYWHCRQVFLVRNIYMWPGSTLTSASWFSSSSSSQYLFHSHNAVKMRQKNIKNIRNEKGQQGMGCTNSWPVHNNRHNSVNCTSIKYELYKISPVEDWRSTSLEWPWPWIRPYSIPSCITHRPLFTYQIALRSEEKIFRRSRLRFWSSSESSDTKTIGQFQKSGPIKFRYCALV